MSGDVVPLKFMRGFNWLSIYLTVPLKSPWKHINFSCHLFHKKIITAVPLLHSWRTLGIKLLWKSFFFFPFFLAVVLCESVLKQICILLIEVQAADVRHPAVAAAFIDNELCALDLVLHHKMFHLQASHMRNELHNIFKIISPILKQLFIIIWKGCWLIHQGIKTLQNTNFSLSKMREPHINRDLLSK